MKQLETAYLYDCIRGFSTRKFQFMDIRVFNSDGIADLYRRMVAGQLGALNGFCWRSNTGGAYSKDGKSFLRFGLPGLMDISAIAIGGKFLGCEVKQPGKKRSKVQTAAHECVRFFGGYSFLACGFEDTVTELKAIGF